MNVVDKLPSYESESTLLTFSNHTRHPKFKSMPDMDERVKDSRIISIKHSGLIPTLACQIVIVLFRKDILLNCRDTTPLLDLRYEEVGVGLEISVAMVRDSRKGGRNVK